MDKRDTAEIYVARLCSIKQKGILVNMQGLELFLGHEGIRLAREIHYWTKYYSKELGEEILELSCRGHRSAAWEQLDGYFGRPTYVLKYADLRRLRKGEREALQRSLNQVARKIGEKPLTLVAN